MRASDEDEGGKDGRRSSQFLVSPTCPARGLSKAPGQGIRLFSVERPVAWREHEDEDGQPDGRAQVLKARGEIGLIECELEDGHGKPLRRQDSKGGGKRQE